MKTLYEGILKGMDDTIKSGESDIAAVNKDTIVDGITSNDPWKQKQAKEMFEEIVKDNKIKRLRSLSKIDLSNGWCVQFKKDDTIGIPEFTMFAAIKSYWYIVYIDKFGSEPKYWRVPHTDFHFRYIKNLLDPRQQPMYSVSNDDALHDMCDKIFRIMFNR